MHPKITGGAVSHYESGRTELTPEMAERFAQALGVRRERVIIYSKTIQEETPVYQADTIRVDMIPDELLEILYKDFGAQALNASGAERMKFNGAMHVIAKEQERRAAQPDEVILHERRKPGANSERVAQLAASSKAALVKIGVLPAAAAGGKGSHSPPSEVDAPSDQTHPRPPASSGESKAPPHGHGGKDRR